MWQAEAADTEVTLSALPATAVGQILLTMAKFCYYTVSPSWFSFKLTQFTFVGHSGVSFGRLSTALTSAHIEQFQTLYNRILPKHHICIEPSFCLEQSAQFHNGNITASKSKMKVFTIGCKEVWPYFYFFPLKTCFLSYLLGFQKPIQYSALHQFLFALTWHSMTFPCVRILGKKGQ